jgi:hypothetical protein
MVRMATPQDDPEGIVDPGEASWLTSKPEDGHAGYANELNIEVDVDLEDRRLLQLLADDTSSEDTTFKSTAAPVINDITAEEDCDINMVCNRGV